MTDTPHQPMLRFLLVLTVASTMGLQAWQLLFNNFAVDVVGLDGSQVPLRLRQPCWPWRLSSKGRGNSR